MVVSFFNIMFVLVRNCLLEYIGRDVFHAPFHEVGCAILPIYGPDVELDAPCMDALHQFPGDGENVNIQVKALCGYLVQEGIREIMAIAREELHGLSGLLTADLSQVLPLEGNEDHPVQVVQLADDVQELGNLLGGQKVLDLGYGDLAVLLADAEIFLL